MQHTMILQRGWPLIEKTPHWSFGYLVCLIPVMVARGAMKVKSMLEEKKENQNFNHSGLKRPRQ